MLILNFKPYTANTLRGFVDIEFDIGLQSFEWTLHAGTNGPWLMPPGKAQIGSDKQLRLKPDGKINYTAVLKWKDDATKRKFDQHAIKLILQKYPHALDPT